LKVGFFWGGALVPVANFVNAGYWFSLLSALPSAFFNLAAGMPNRIEFCSADFFFHSTNAFIFPIRLQIALEIRTWHGCYVTVDGLKVRNKG
jgi:hypothetical protein